MDEEKAMEALSQVKRLTHLLGRWEIMERNPLLVLDVGHNADGVKQILNQLKVETYHQLHIVIGMVKDKDISQVLTLLPKEARYYFTQAHIPRAMPVDQFAAQAASNGLFGNSYADVNTAIAAAKQKANPQDLILVCGSVFLVGEVKRR